jgi:hypothetical protein
VLLRGGDDGSGTASLTVYLRSAPGAAPAGLQWTFQLPPSGVRFLNIDDGPAITAAGKAVICAEDAGAYNCLAVGANSKVIETGIIARVTAQLSPGTGTAAVLIRNPLAVSADGRFIPISSDVIPTTDRSGSLDCRIRPRPRSVPVPLRLPDGQQE